MRSLQANQYGLTSVDNRVSAARAVPLPLHLERIPKQIVVRSSHQLGQSEPPSLTRALCLGRALQFGNSLYGRGIKLLLYADRQEISLADGSNHVNRDFMEKGPFLSKSVSKLIAHNTCPGVGSQFKRRIRSQHVRLNLVDNDSAPAIERGPESTPQVTVLEAALASPPSLIKALDQIIAVRANNQIAQSTLQQLKKGPNFRTIRTL